jgi:hypothetical protein
MKNKIMLIALLLCVPNAVWAEVTQRITWQLNGPPGKLQALVKEGVALQAKINPKVGYELWNGMVHGSNVNRVSLIVFYDDLEHFAQATKREEANEEWSAFMSRFPADLYPTTYVGLANTVVGEGATAIKGGEALAVIVFAPKGSVADLASLVGEAVKIQSRVNPKASISLTATTVAGQNVGGAAVLARYPSLADWAEGVAKLQANEAWREFLQDFPADKYPIVYQGLSRGVAIH